MKNILNVMVLLVLMSVVVGCSNAPQTDDAPADVVGGVDVPDTAAETTDAQVESELDEVFISEEDDVEIGEMY